MSAEVAEAQCTSGLRWLASELIVREREIEGHHVVTKIDTADNLADLLTKALDPIPFEKLRRFLLNVLAVGAIYPVPRARRIAAKRAASTSD